MVLCLYRTAHTASHTITCSVALRSAASRGATPVVSAAAPSCARITAVVAARQACPALQCWRAPVAAYHASPPAHGLLDRMKSWMESRTAAGTHAAKRKMFATQLQMLMEMPKYTLEEHATILRASLEKASSGIISRALLGQEDMRESVREDAATDVKLIESMTPDERRDPTLMHRREKARVAGAAGVDAARVNVLLAGFAQSARVHAWAHARMKKGLPVPKEPEEFVATLMSDKSAMTGAAVRESMGNTRGTRAMLKRMA